MKWIKSFFLSCLLLCSLYGCSQKDSPYDQEIVSHNIVKENGKAYGEVRTIGAKKYYNNSQAPGYSIFLIKDDSNIVFSTRYIDDELTYAIPQGHYAIVSEEIGVEEFDILAEDETILIVLNYDSKEIAITKNYEFE